VHEFVQNDGLACLIKVGSEADQNYQNYILRGEYPVPFLSNSSSIISSLTFVQSTHARRCMKSCFVGPTVLCSLLVVLVLDCVFCFKEIVREMAF
jgi:hypothetical protein